jgi:hypothetical protein
MTPLQPVTFLANSGLYARLVRLAFTLADESAKSLIECESLAVIRTDPHPHGGQRDTRWLDVKGAPDYVAAPLLQAIEYLVMRGELVLRDGENYLVQFVEASE